MPRFNDNISCSAQLISFELVVFSRAEHEYMNIHPPIIELTL